jgi:hypothetical protein
MTDDNMPAYGLWWLVIINSAVFIFFAFTFFKPQTKRDWRSFGAFSAFLVALFTEMYRLENQPALRWTPIVRQPEPSSKV